MTKLHTTPDPPEQGWQHKQKAGELGEATAEAEDRHAVDNPPHRVHMPKADAEEHAVAGSLHKAPVFPP